VAERRYTEMEKMINHLLNSCIDHLRLLGIDPTDGAVRPPTPRVITSPATLSFAPIMTKDNLIKLFAKHSTLRLKLAILLCGFCYFFAPGLTTYTFLHVIAQRTDLDALSADWKILLEDFKGAK
jgi:hypothetical protein